MFRKRIVVVLVLLAFGSTALQCSTAPLPTVGHALPVAHLVETHDHVALDSEAVRTLGLNTRVGLGLLDQRAEVAFDHVALDSEAVRTLGLNTRVGLGLLDQRAESLFDD
jgi:hypothetical protein